MEFDISQYLTAPPSPEGLIAAALRLFHDNLRGLQPTFRQLSGIESATVGSHVFSYQNGQLTPMRGTSTPKFERYGCHIEVTISYDETAGDTNGDRQEGMVIPLHNGKVLKCYQLVIARPDEQGTVFVDVLTEMITAHMLALEDALNTLIAADHEDVMGAPAETVEKEFGECKQELGPTRTCTVYVDDNFHYHDESERYKLGEFDDREGAIQACKDIVDAFLRSTYKPGMTPKELYQHYTMFGEDPFIISKDPECSFSAWEYAKMRCDEICR